MKVKSNLGRGNLIFCCMGNQDNYFGLVSQQSIRVGTSKNKNTDHQVKETCAIMSI